MKWFKHFSDAHDDTRVKRVIRKYGLRGYGLYFVCIEYIANQLTPESPKPDLEENARDIAETFGEDTILIEEILHFIIYEQGLLSIDEDTGRLVCLKLLTHLDNTLSNNPQIKQILSKFGQLKETSSNFKKLNTDKIRLEENRIDKNNNTISSEKSDCDSFDRFWDMYDKKTSKPKCQSKWKRLKQSEKDAIFEHLPKYIEATPDKQYRKMPITYLNNRTWEDEYLPSTNTPTNHTKRHEQAPSASYRPPLEVDQDEVDRDTENFFKAIGEMK